MNVGSLFSGIGGIDLGLERAGMRVVWQAESDPWCRSILARHWPGVPCYHDVRSIVADTESFGGSARGQNGAATPRPNTGTRGTGQRPVPVRVPPVDVLAGGFPCQPVSLAGKGLAQQDERWLWPEFARLIRLLRPRYVIAENVPGLLTRGLDIVLADLAALRFDAEWTVFGARDVGAPHKRDRVWIVAWDTDRVADSLSEPVRVRPRGLGGAPGTAEGSRDQRERLRPDALNGGTAVADPDEAGRREQRWPGAARPELSAAERDGWWRVEPDVGRVAHGIPNRVDRLRALGNAVVPACAEHIGRLVMEMHP